ncbi:hypothetical protein FIV42_17815 [Persicimonas caeni]|uniref:SWIM-type domain-containing protein n=1 Tax=Persicimonas caeni TaxID=2292766 RepID=A0A4Y6PW94_PERCE|nr:SWIM zinc finger family protein [Persicimonas caeni]QDG52523.1 hypothetical protein FIV42_17815 [Persicimonas caeni]QED33745.1 hypothetical protein FRD00_17810 [Persicimonas caeni]
MSWSYFPKSTPRKVEGGIKAKSKRGKIGEEWWSRRFVEVVESYSISSRIKRGKRYARGGQVIALAIDDGMVHAQVQGSRPNPYKVDIGGASLGDEDWEQVEQAMSERAAFAAQLLAGEMPADIEEAFEACEFSLFPASYKKMETHCSCPDSANPCKHIAAVFYILAEKFDEDPFLIFRWRGRSREELLDHLRRLRSSNARAAGSQDDLPAEPSTPLSECLDNFWSAGPSLERIRIRPGLAEIPDAALRRLGKPPERIAEVRDELGALYARIVGSASE